jgi:hypothetical protein
MSPLTDDAVARLPIHEGRAALLEELVAAPAVRRTPSRWAVPLAAAAAVLALLAGAAWWSTAGDRPTEWARATEAPPDAYRAVLDDDGWWVSGGDAGSLTYAREAWVLEISWYPASDHAARVADRSSLGAATPLTVLGVPARVWAYSADDRTAITDVFDGHYLEVRGIGMDDATYASLLDRLRLTDAAGVAAASQGVTGSSSDAILEGILAYVKPLSPPSLDGLVLEPDRSSRYAYQRSVTSFVVCPWLDDYVAARAEDDTARADKAAAVLATTRQWPVLQDMGGRYPTQVWGYADQVAVGTVPTGYREALRCAPPG